MLFFLASSLTAQFAVHFCGKISEKNKKWKKHRFILLRLPNKTNQQSNKNA
jgi:hypothetical protein